MEELFEKLTKRAVNPSEVNERASQEVYNLIQKINETDNFDTKIEYSKIILDIVCVAKSLNSMELLNEYYNNKEFYQEQLKEITSYKNYLVDNPYNLCFCNKNDNSEKKLEKCNGVINLFLHSIENRITLNKKLGDIDFKEVKSYYKYLYACVYINEEIIEELKEEERKKIIDEQSKEVDKLIILQDDFYSKRLNNLEITNLQFKNTLEKNKNYNEPRVDEKYINLQYEKFNIGKYAIIENSIGEMILLRKLGKLNFEISESENEFDRDIFYYSIDKYNVDDTVRATYHVFSGEILTEGTDLSGYYEYYTSAAKYIADKMLSDENLLESIGMYYQYIGDLTVDNDKITSKRKNYKSLLIQNAKSRKLFNSSIGDDNRII